MTRIAAGGIVLVLVVAAAAFVLYSALPAATAIWQGGEANAPAPQGGKLIILIVIAVVVVTASTCALALAFWRREVLLAVLAACATASVVVMWGWVDELLAASPAGTTPTWPTSAQAAIAITIARQLLGGLLVVVLLAAAWRADRASYLATLGMLAIIGLPLVGAAGALGLGVKESEAPKRAEVVLTVDVVGQTPASGADVSIVFLVPKIADDGTVTGHEAVRRAAKLVDIPVGCTQNCSATVTLARGDDDAIIAAVLADRLNTRLAPVAEGAAAVARIFLVGPTATSPDPG